MLTLVSTTNLFSGSTNGGLKELITYLFSRTSRRILSLSKNLSCLCSCADALYVVSISATLLFSAVFGKWISFLWNLSDEDNRNLHVWHPTYLRVLRYYSIIMIRKDDSFHHHGMRKLGTQTRLLRSESLVLDASRYVLLVISVAFHSCFC